MTIPPFLRPLVVPFDARVPDRRGTVDVYAPDAGQPQPAVVLVHGGPIPAEQRPTPRDWPVFQGYASIVAARGGVGATVDLPLHAAEDLPRAAGVLAEAVETVRGDPRVDARRIALWFFSGGGLLSADWLRSSPPWLRCVAASYPVLACPPELGTRFNPAVAIGEAGPVPVVLTRVGRERAPIAGTVEGFVSAARACGAALEIIDVPGGQHAFDMFDDTDESRRAVDEAISRVLDLLLRP